ncbi:MAG: hypothetical protein EOO06_12390 [Chitinophagaceae bacterium]|nr:MAG: hypothetical protein EOO06_12390 [Chitinophagaceae bacterium]
MKNKSVYDFSVAESDAVNTLRTITLFGKNVSTYKFALLSTLMQRGPSDALKYQDIRDGFVKELFRHYKGSPAQYTGGSNSLTHTFDDYLKNGEVQNEWQKVIAAAEPLIYKNVFDAFHNVGGGSIANQFILFEHDKKGKQLILTDNLNSILEVPELRNSIEEENQGRWRVVEEAWRSKLSPNLLVYNDQDKNFYSLTVSERVCLRSAVSVLLPYQHGRCFYCNRKVDTMLASHEGAFPDVDHFFPLSFLVMFQIQPVNPNGIWNLVIACKDCNRGEKGKFASPADNSYFKKLHRRNLLFVEEHRHSLKNSILISLAAQDPDGVTARMQGLYEKFRYLKGWKPPIIYP